MDLLTVLLFAVALCFDSFAVSISSGLGCCTWRRGRGFRFAVILGLMQGLMLFIGWALAHRFHEAISEWDHWIAFGLLIILGCKMIWGALGDTEDDSQKLKGDPLRFSNSLVLGLATSIDAIIAGVSVAFIGVALIDGSQLLNISIASFIVSLVTIIASVVGLYLGRRSRGRLGERAELIGGIVLLLIGVKVLIEHLQ